MNVGSADRLADSHGIRIQEIAAIRIQTAFRAYKVWVELQITLFFCLIYLINFSFDLTNIYNNIMCWLVPGKENPSPFERNSKTADADSEEFDEKAGNHNIGLSPFME